MDLNLERLEISSSSSSSMTQDLREGLKKLREMRQMIGHEVHPISHMMMMMPRCPPPLRCPTPTLNINRIQEGVNKGLLEVAGPSKEKTPTPYPQTHPLDEYLDSPESPSIVSLQGYSPNTETKSSKTNLTPPLQKKENGNLIQNPNLKKTTKTIIPPDLLTSAAPIQTGAFQHFKSLQTPAQSQNVRDSVMPTTVSAIAHNVTSIADVHATITKQGLPAKIKPIRLGFATKTIRPPNAQVPVSIQTTASSRPEVATTMHVSIPVESTQNASAPIKRPIPVTKIHTSTIGGPSVAAPQMIGTLIKNKMIV